MTEQRIAGRELDAEIAERVLGYTYDRVAADDERWVEHRMYGHNGLWVTRASDLPTKYGIGLPHYSTDIAAAWRVVERMRDQAPVGFRNLSMTAYCYNRTYATFDAGAFGDYDPETWVEANGEYATPLAICLAALAAMLDKPTGAVTPTQDRTPSSQNANTIPVAVSRAEDRTT